MFKQQIIKWEETITQKENLALIKKISQQFYQNHSIEDCWYLSQECWLSPYFQIQEIATLLCGYIACDKYEALIFLRDVVSYHSDWRVQEVLAMAFDCYCGMIGYENSLNAIYEWITLKNPNNRRAVSEGLRVWTNRLYFDEHPQIAINILSSLKEDESLYVRKSVGNALRAISRKFPQLIKEELKSWDISNQRINQVYKRAYKYIEKKGD